MEKLNENFRPGFVPPDSEFYITLTSTNDLATVRNMEKLEALPGPMHRYDGILTGELDRTSLPVEGTLRLKPGAQVMLVNNDKYGLWVNGTLGKITGIEKENDEEDRILVMLEDNTIVEVTPYTWELFEYQYDRTSKRIYTRKTGAFTQYPIRLAWAVTIHKSQGKTFDKVVVDVGRGTFAHGQVYVALSRCTNFSGIVLTRKITKAHIRMDWRVSQFLTRFQYRKAEERVCYDERRRVIYDAIRRGINLDILYLKPDDTKSHRTIKPVSVEEMEYRGKTFEGLRAYCCLRKEERSFRIDRILEMDYSVGSR